MNKYIKLDTSKINKLINLLNENLNVCLIKFIYNIANTTIMHSKSRAFAIVSNLLQTFDSYVNYIFLKYIL